MRIVCDTSVFIAALLADGLCRDIVKKRLPRHELLTSETLLQELEDKLRLKFEIDPRQIPLVQLYRSTASIISPMPLQQSVCRDPDDDEVLAVA